MSANSPFELTTPPVPVDAAELEAIEYGVPRRIVVGLATQIAWLLISNAITPNSVYFRSRGARPEDSTEAEASSDLGEGPGVDDLFADIVEENVVREDAGAAAQHVTEGPPPLLAEMGTIDDLFNADDTVSNPIHTAGVSDASFVDVYDIATVDSLAASQEETAALVTEGQLASEALIARIRLNYEITGQTA